MEQIVDRLRGEIHLGGCLFLRGVHSQDRKGFRRKSLEAQGKTFGKWEFCDHERAANRDLKHRARTQRNSSV